MGARPWSYIPTRPVPPPCLLPVKGTGHLVGPGQWERRAIRAHNEQYNRRVWVIVPERSRFVCMHTDCCHRPPTHLYSSHDHSHTHTHTHARSIKTSPRKGLGRKHSGPSPGRHAGIQPGTSTTRKIGTTDALTATRVRAAGGGHSLGWIHLREGHGHICASQMRQRIVLSFRRTT